MKNKNNKKSRSGVECSVVALPSPDILREGNNFMENMVFSACMTSNKSVKISLSEN